MSEIWRPVKGYEDLYEVSSERHPLVLCIEGG